MSELQVLIVEDDPRACKAFSDYAEALVDVRIVGITADANEAVKIISTVRPHAVILDLELSGGDGSGLDVLRGVKDARLGYSPFFLVTTVITSNVLLDEVRSLGGDYTLAKHMPSYSEVYALDFLRKMSDRILRSVGDKAELPPESSDRLNQCIRQQTTAEMNRIGISPKMKGCAYLIDGIEFLANRSEGNLYAALATQYGKTPESIEQAMKYAIEKAWLSTDVDILCKYFTARISSASGVPTVTEFIYYYARKIRDDLGLED